MGQTSPPSSGASCHQSHLQTTSTGSAFGTPGAGDIHPRLALSDHSQPSGGPVQLSLPELDKLLNIDLTAHTLLTAQASPRAIIFFYSSCNDSNVTVFLPEFIILIMKQLSIWRRKQKDGVNLKLILLYAKHTLAVFSNYSIGKYLSREKKFPIRLSDAFPLLRKLSEEHFVQNLFKHL